MKKSNLMFVFGLLIPVVLVFRVFFQDLSLVWGDAPFFYPERLMEYVGEPSAWVSYGKTLGGVNPVLFLSPLMIVYGLLHSAFGLNNDIIVRILFYFPSVILAILGTLALTRYLKLGKRTQFFATLVYVLNTYYLLLIDGGQVGVALAYGLFPFVLLSLKRLVDKPSRDTFFRSLLLTFILTTIDPRISVISLLAIVIWAGRSKLFYKYIFFLIVALIGLNSYWLVPLLKVDGGIGFAGLLSKNPVSFFNSLLLYQPHWPGNEFGRVISPPLYFWGIPLLVFGSLLFKKKRKYKFILLFFIFLFLAKGDSAPFGGIYNFIVTNIPFGVAFRDSSKFFIPLILIAGILIGQTTEKVKSKLILLGIYLYLLFLVSPALLGDLNFVLSGNKHSEDYYAIKERLAEDDSLYRTAWFPERHPLAFHTSDKPALDAKYLVNLRPFSMMNVGSYDVFNFMHNDRFLDFFDILGIRYLIFPGDLRKTTFDETEIKSWDNLISYIDTVDGLEKMDWGVKVPVYRLADTKPRIYAVNRLIAVIGGDYLYDLDSLEIDNIGLVFLEDGISDPQYFEDLDPESVSLVFNDKEEKDLAMSFLQDYFISADSAGNSDWATYSFSEYLTWKYQLLIRGLNVKEHTYSRGATLSTNEKEKMEFDLKIKESGEYVLAIRALTDDKKNTLRYNIEDDAGEVLYNREGSFEWFTKDLGLKKGKHKLKLENNGGLSSVNIVALIPKTDYNDALEKTKTYIAQFGTTTSQSVWKEIEFEKKSLVRYTIVPPKSSNWIIFSDSYHPEWKLRKGVEYYDSVPVYSMINGFYIEDDWIDTEIVFEGQKEFRKGIYLSVVSILTLSITYLWYYPKKR